MSTVLAEMWTAHPDYDPTPQSLIRQGVRYAGAMLVPDSAGDEGEPAPDTWREWLTTLFPSYTSRPFADRHVAFWEWLWSIELGLRPRPFVGIWPRGGAKSTSAELGVCALGVRGKRRYGWYVRATQDDADDSVSNIGALLESGSVARHYPQHGQRLVGKFGSSKGWRRERLRTMGGFTIDALGLDVAARGTKLEDQRPDVIVIDDVDALHDTPQATEKKIATLTQSILPAGALDGSTAVIAIQNLLIPNGVFAHLADGRADFLADRIASGPYPAIENLRTEVKEDERTGKRYAVIVSGTPTWEGQDLQVCQNQIITWGYRAFDREAQHNVKNREGALWTDDVIRHITTMPKLKRIAIGVDPSGGGNDIGIVAAGLGYDNRGYVIADGTQKGGLGPLNWGRKTVSLYDDLKADRIVAEKNFGGDMVESNIRVSAGQRVDGAQRHVPVHMVNASRGKAQRAEPVASLYEDKKVDHVGYFPELESEMTGWVPGDPWSPNRVDALVWVLTELMLGAQGQWGTGRHTT